MAGQATQSWDLEAKVRALQANWILKFLRGDLTGSLKELIQNEVEEWAEDPSHFRHLLNDPDDHREVISSAPIGEILYSWSKITSGEITPDTTGWYGMIVRSSKRGIVSEEIKGPFKVETVEEDRVLARHYVLGSNKWIKGKSTEIPATMLVRIGEPDLAGKCTNPPLPHRHQGSCQNLGWGGRHSQN